MSLFSRLFKGDKPQEGEQPGEATEGAEAAAGAEQRADTAKEAASKTPRAGEASAEKAAASKAGSAAKPAGSAAADRAGPPPLRASAKGPSAPADEKTSGAAKAAAQDATQARGATGAESTQGRRAGSPSAAQTRAAASPEAGQPRGGADAAARGSGAEAARASAAGAGTTQTRGGASTNTAAARSGTSPDAASARGASPASSQARPEPSPEAAPRGARVTASTTGPTSPAQSAARPASALGNAAAKPRPKAGGESPSAPREAAPVRDATERIGFPLQQRPEELAKVARRDATEPMATLPDDRTEELAARPPEVGAQPAVAVQPSPSPREAFDASASRALTPLACLALELAWSQTAPSEWAAPCGAAVRSLRAAAEKLEDAALTSVLDDLLALLNKAQAGSLIEGELGRELLRVYAGLCAQIPGAQPPEGELARRDRALVEALLTQVEGLHHAAVHRMDAAGFCASQRLLRSSAEELARETGLAPELAQRIVDTFQAFRREHATMAPDLRSSEELRKLSALLEELRVQQMQFEQASTRFRDQDLLDRRLMRAARARSLRRIYVLLARLGEVDRIGQLERVPFQAKIAELTDYLRAVTRAAA